VSGSKSQARSDLPRATVWSDTARRRWFLVPDDAALPPGPFGIRTPAGRSAVVEEQAVQRFEVTREQAQRWLLDHLDPAIAAIRGTVEQVAEKINEAAERMSVETAEARREARESWTGAADVFKEAMAGLKDEWRKARDQASSGEKPAQGEHARALEIFAARLGELADEARAKAEAARERTVPKEPDR
jgi:hypothetical protein